MTIYETLEESKAKFHYCFRCYDCSATIIHKTFEFIGGVTVVSFHENDEKIKQFLSIHGKQYISQGKRPLCKNKAEEQDLNDMLSLISSIKPKD